MAKLKINKDDRIVTAWPEYVSGPGWANRPIWVIVRDGNGKLRMECIQPEDQTENIMRLFPICAVAHSEFMSTLNSELIKKKS